MTKAVVLLSGGLDSTTCLYWSKAKEFKTYALIVDYGQRHGKEIFKAVKIAKTAGVPYNIVRFSLPWGGSALIDKRMPVPKNRRPEKMAKDGIPSTYVPGRNTIFLSFAVSFAEAIGASAIIIGANAVDYSGYPDCRPNYIRSMQRAAALGTKSGSLGNTVKIIAPLIRLSKAGIIKLGKRLKVPYGATWSCYKGGQKPCMTCDSCLLRAKGFKEAGVDDPAL